ncbi:MAG: AMP-binding protein [Chloroflexaceae bacterium]|nr:AMP-binding protein [Chloroflexaceae bacterium]
MHYSPDNPPPSVLHAFVETCRRTPSKPCLSFEGQTYTYAQVYGAARAYQSYLPDMGMLPGDRVALYLANSPAFLAAYLGIWMAGGTVVLINTQYRQVELHHILSDSGARICITDANSTAPLAPFAEHVFVYAAGNPDGHLTSADDPQGRGVRWHTPDELPAPDSLALLAYTSGTTGRSKGAMLTHRNLAANSAAVTTAWHWTADDTLLLTLPLFHIHGLGVGIHGTFLAGSTVDLRRRFDAAAVYDTLSNGDVTLFFGVPTMYTRLLAEAAQCDPHGTRPAPPLRLFVSGSAPLNPHTFAAFEQRFGQPILERYGMTETGMNLTNPYHGERRPGTVGQPFPGQEARIVDIQTRQPVPPETEGEIQVRGPHVFQGYWQRPDATAAAFDSDGWFNTGDLGWVSSDGYFTIAGRARELIITGGYNVYPREVEEVLLTHPALSEAAVLGLPDTDLGEQVVAVVVARTTLDAAAQHALATELIALCREQLAAYKKPRQVRFVAELPRNALGKVQKHLLAQHLSSSAG